MSDGQERWCAYCMLPSMHPVAFVGGTLVWACEVCGREEEGGDE
jgi:hypothetical protein